MLPQCYKCTNVTEVTFEVTPNLGAWCLKILASIPVLCPPLICGQTVYYLLVDFLLNTLNSCNGELMHY